VATRLYFCDSQSAAFNIGAQVGSLWEQNISGAFTTKRLRTTGDGNANTNHFTTNLGNGSNPCDIAFGQFMTDTLPSGVLISGTVQGVIVCREGNTSDNMYTQLGLYVVDSSGALVHTLLGGANSGGTEMNSPSANTRNLPRNGSTAISSYTTVNATSRVVAEIGMRTESTRTTCQGYMYFGAGDGGSDLPTGDASSNNLFNRPWIEFSADIFTPPAGGGARSFAAVAMSGYHDQDPEEAPWDGRHGPFSRRRASGLWVR
jgi:hypothetical protein